MFVDGRYSVQAEAQVDKSVFAIEHLVDAPPAQWLEQHVKAAARSATIPGCTRAKAPSRFKAACAKAGAELVAVADNPIDALWSDRPAAPAAPVTLRDVKLAGESAADKLKRVQAELAQAARRRAGGVGCAEPGLDLQHPRRRRAAYAAGARLRAGAARGQADALPRARQARQPSARRARADRRRAQPRCAGSRSGQARRQDRLARPGERGRHPDPPDRRQWRQARARRRSDHADEGGEEPYRDRRHARGPQARRRGGRALSLLARARGAARQVDARSTRSRRWKASAATPACSRTSRFRPSPAPGRTGRSCITASRKARTGGSA